MFGVAIHQVAHRSLLGIVAGFDGKIGLFPTIRRVAPIFCLCLSTNKGAPVRRSWGPGIFHGSFRRCRSLAGQATAVT